MFDPLPPLNALRSFILVAEKGSLAAAAALQNITQPAVSKRIKLLESHLGLCLLDRRPNTIALTNAGRQYAEDIRKAFRSIEDATSRLQIDRAGPLRLRCYTTWATRWLIPRLPKFREAHPECEIEIRTSVEPVDFARDDVAAAVASAGEFPPIDNAGRLQSILIAPFAAPGVAARMANSLAGSTRLASKNRPADWETWQKATGTAMTGPILTFETTALAIEVALSGLGVVIASKFMVAEDLACNRLVQLGELVDSGSRYWLILPQKVDRPGTYVFRDWLIAEVEQEENSVGGWGDSPR